jgi:hypothetical protein
MRMQSKVVDLEPDLMGEVLVDVMQELMPLSHGKLPFIDCNHAILMHLCWAPLMYTML